MKKQPRTPDILRKSHAHKSDKDYSRKNSKSDWFDEDDTVTDTDKDKLNITFEKTWPTNYHEDYYATRHGWEYLGSDKKHDYYVNHKWKLTSIVYGSEPNEYISGGYNYYVNPANLEDIYPYTQLRKLLEGS